jgi:hypothetical protein
VLTRDGSKTLANDTPDLPDMRRLSTRALRAERDRLAHLRAQCPPDRSRELQLANHRAAEAEQARRQAGTDHQAAADQVMALAGRWWGRRGRRELAAARERLVLAEHALKTTSGQADQAAERLGCSGGRSSGTWAGWRPHDASCGCRNGRWPGKMPGGAGSTSAPWPWTRRAGCWPNSAWSRATPRSGRCGARPLENRTATGAPTAWTIHRRRSIVGQRGPGWAGWRAGRCRHRGAGRREPRAAEPPQPRRRRRSPMDHQQRPTVVAGQRYQVERLLGAEPRR